MGGLCNLAEKYGLLAGRMLFAFRKNLPIMDAWLMIAGMGTGPLSLDKTTP